MEIEMGTVMVDSEVLCYITMRVKDTMLAYTLAVFDKYQHVCV